MSNEDANDASISEQLGNCVCNPRLQRASCTVAAIHCETWRRRSSVTIHENDDKQPRHRFLAIAADQSTLIGETPACNCARTYPYVCVHLCVCVCVFVCACACERERARAKERGHAHIGLRCMHATAPVERSGRKYLGGGRERFKQTVFQQ